MNVRLSDPARQLLVAAVNDPDRMIRRSEVDAGSRVFIIVGTTKFCAPELQFDPRPWIAALEELEAFGLVAADSRGRWYRVTEEGSRVIASQLTATP